LFIFLNLTIKIHVTGVSNRTQEHMVVTQCEEDDSWYSQATLERNQTLQLKHIQKQPCCELRKINIFRAW